ncbi:hypothetical protein DICSQDRAFT_171713 [Dichomitus squalens LYAD-421 SS1]|uniref:DUF6535 domain-containing protein n=1 Tax=Dichomitus squalens (strain LYAD-421) TaxID=732165 RepID=R7SXP7_DICSQ|nr:uncharacterized protein DICSQDRAFT_171713 [Dichomitus squalens LYAD-421 SS1]EJF59747.1 hypothetical protein DICSQDRAFT_171713 [Dichomitus squalens LYAD-421 SS1]
MGNLDEKAQVWQSAAEALKDYHDNLVERWQKETDVLLVFAGLLSGVLTTFNIQIYQLLQPGPNDATLAVLEQISKQIDGFSFNGQFLNSSQPARPLNQIQPPFVPAATAVWMNTLWFASLICSLASASIALIVKQWLNGLTVGLSGTSRESARLRQYRLNGLLRWRVGAIVFIPSLLLHIALVFFFTGLLIRLWTLHPTVAVSASAFVGALVILQLVVTILPTIRWDCCYRSPQAVAVYIMYSTGRDVVIRMVQAGARSIRRLTQYRFRCLATLDLWARRLEETPGWRGRERSDILHATGELDRGIAVMPYTTTLSTHYLETLHVVLSDLPREQITLCFEDIFGAWEGQWGKSAWRHTHSVRKEFLVRPVLTALRHLLAIDSEKLSPEMYVQWTAHSKSLLERFLPNVPFPDVEVCTSTFSLVAGGRGDVAELALSRLEHQLAMYQARGMRLSYRACQNGPSPLGTLGVSGY